MEQEPRADCSPLDHHRHLQTNIYLQYLALDVVSNCICEIHCWALHGFTQNTVHLLSSKEKNLGGAGIRTWGCWVGSRNASSVLHSSAPNPQSNIIKIFISKWTWSSLLHPSKSNSGRSPISIFSNRNSSPTSRNEPEVVIHVEDAILSWFQIKWLF